MEKVELAQSFCEEVGMLAEQYGLNVFVVTDGASLTKNGDNGYNDCIYLHRRLHTLWEVKNNIDPTEDWSN